MKIVAVAVVAVEAKMTGRNFIGVDINPTAIEITKTKCAFDFDTQATTTLINGDARKLELDDNSVDLICTHPPYADIIHYSENIEGDLSLLSIKPFLMEMGKVADECYRVLKKGKFCAILIISHFYLRKITTKTLSHLISLKIRIVLN